MDDDGYGMYREFGSVSHSPDDDLNDETFGVDVIGDDDDWELEKLSKQTREANIHGQPVPQMHMPPGLLANDTLLMQAMYEASVSHLNEAPAACDLPDPNAMFGASLPPQIAKSAPSSSAAPRPSNFDNAAQFGLDLSAVWSYNSSLHSPQRPTLPAAHAPKLPAAQTSPPLSSTIIANIEAHIDKQKLTLATLMNQMTDASLTVEQREQITAVYVELYNGMKSLQKQLDAQQKLSQQNAMLGQQQQQPLLQVQQPQQPSAATVELPVFKTPLPPAPQPPIPPSAPMPKRAMTIAELEEQLLSQATGGPPPPPQQQQQPQVPLPLGQLPQMQQPPRPMAPPLISPQQPLVRVPLGAAMPRMLPPEVIMQMMQQPQIRQQVMQAAVRGQQMPPGFPPAHIFLRSPFAMPPPHMIRPQWGAYNLPPQANVNNNNNGAAGRPTNRKLQYDNNNSDDRPSFRPHQHRGRYDTDNNPHGTWQGNMVSRREREWLIKIYSLGLQQTGNPYVDDFYSTMYKHKQLQRVNVDDHAPADDHVPYVYVAPTFEHTLGKPCTVTAAGPRQLIDVGRPRIDSSNDVETAVEDRAGRWKTNLMLIERAFSLLMEAEDKKRHVVHLDSEIEAICDRAYTTYLSGPARLLQLLDIAKCGNLVSRLLALCSSATTTRLLTDLTSQLYMLAKRDLRSDIYVRVFGAIYAAMSKLNTDQLLVVALPMNAHVVKSSLSVRSNLVTSLVLGLLFMMGRRQTIVTEDGTRLQIQHWMTAIYDLCRRESGGDMENVNSMLPEWYKCETHWKPTALWLREQMDMGEEDLERIAAQLFK